MTHSENPEAPDPSQPDLIALPLVGVAEIRDLLVHVSRQYVLELTLRSDFPEPAAELAAGDVWSRADVDAWIDEHREAVADMLKPAG